MTTATINMKLDADTANIFMKAPIEDRNKLCVLWSVLLREYKAASMPLSKLMDQVGARAKARGLNADKLGSILDAE
ncbi:MAG: hypothetical protein HYV35_02185 [Lentisphaerae bacterium]|nr:hypothetical protein [Lentisphaerota bacterium]